MTPNQISDILNKYSLESHKIGGGSTGDSDAGSVD
jgi:hypothetical protein